MVVTCPEVLDRSTLADARLRLRLLSAALDGADAVLAGSEAGQAALRRWMACDARVLGPADGAAHERLYRELLAG